MFRFIDISAISGLQIFQSLRFSAAILISIMLVKSGLELKEISYFEVLFFLGNLVSVFWIQGLKNAFLSYFPSLNSSEQAKLIYNAFLIFFALGATAAILLFVSQDAIIHHLTQYNNIPYIHLISVYLLFNTPTILIEFLYLLKELPRKIVKYGGVAFGMQLLLVGTALLVFKNLYWIIIALIGWAILKFCWLVILLFRYADFSFDSGLLKKFFVFSFPLVIHILLGNAMEYIDGFIVSSNFDEEYFAIFRYGARELPINLILVGALVNAMIPALIKDQEVSLNILKAKTNQLVRWLFPLSMLLMLISPVAFPLVYNDDFTTSAKIFNLYLLIIGSRIILSQAIVYAKHDNSILAGFAFLELICNLALSLWWVKLFGLEGIVYATIVAYLFNKILLILYVKIRYDIPLNRYLDIKSYVIFNVFLFLSYFISLQY